MCMNTSMVSPIHILLFGAHKVDYTDGCIVLDDWFVKLKTMYSLKIMI
jgi:hypothetical protein